MSTLDVTNKTLYLIQFFKIFILCSGGMKPNCPALQCTDQPTWRRLTASRRMSLSLNSLPRAEPLSLHGSECTGEI